MVKFESTKRGLDVLIAHAGEWKLFGRLQKDYGFTTDSTVVTNFLVVPAEDFAMIALKADEVKKYGNSIPSCPSCKGTPNLPEKIYNPAEGMQLCQSDFHPFNIRISGKL